ncbi:uncharacterized protein K489DRAFT_373716 [Dissoconium aciculare CBS 342.82]|uniref:Uncharacterized protein n=1 Tax=Dissoconium aciculare CBS 342.82 TaxID=1314786 RepID=A0A6J3LXA1_9PEZI|nr:uncharacterized protein K489DRAFT_373716 [Dissoconium aciculare CBS 342.82]KAF1819267.1 hypothetical protein K489DRAFT_373716 [Dissoconium aciculare CBS 342.82]
MHSPTLALTTLLTLTTLASASTTLNSPISDLHVLVSRQSSGGSSDSATCRNGIAASCVGSSATANSCRSALCSTSCLKFVPGIQSCCDDKTSDIATFSKCGEDKIASGSATVSPTATAAPKTNGVDHLGVGAGQLGVVGSAAAWALGWLLVL